MVIRLKNLSGAIKKYNFIAKCSRVLKGVLLICALVFSVGTARPSYAYSIPINENFVYKGRSNFGFVSNYIGTSSNNATLRATKSDGTMSASAGTYLLAEFTVDSSTSGYASWNAISLTNFYFRGDNGSVPFSSEFLYYSTDSQGPSATYYAIAYVSSGSGSFNNVYFTGEVRFDSVTAVQDSVKVTAFSYSGDSPDFSSIITKLNSINSSLDNIESDVGDISSLLNSRFPTGDITLQNGQYVCTDDGDGIRNENCGYATLPTDLYNRWHFLEEYLKSFTTSIDDMSSSQSEIVEHNEKEEQAVDNIERQEESPVESQSMSSLGGNLLGFLAVFQNVKPSDDCKIEPLVIKPYGANSSYEILPELDFCTGKNFGIQVLLNTAMSIIAVAILIFFSINTYEYITDIIYNVLLGESYGGKK